MYVVQNSGLRTHENTLALFFPLLDYVEALLFMSVYLAMLMSVFYPIARSYGILANLKTARGKPRGRKP